MKLVLLLLALFQCWLASEAAQTPVVIDPPGASNTWAVFESAATGLDRVPLLLGQHIAPNNGGVSFDEPRSNVVTTIFSLNTDASGNAINPAMPVLKLVVEFAWQNMTNFTQLELYWLVATPTNGLGQSSSFRMNADNLVWKTQTREFYDLNGQILRDRWGIENPRTNGGVVPLFVQTGGNYVGADLRVMGSIRVLTNAVTPGVIYVYGGVANYSANGHGLVSYDVYSNGDASIGAYNGSAGRPLRFKNFSAVDVQGMLFADAFIDDKVGDIGVAISNLQSRVAALEQHK